MTPASPFHRLDSRSVALYDVKTRSDAMSACRLFTVPPTGRTRIEWICRGVRSGLGASNASQVLVFRLARYYF
jgi:hypothetical protein